MTRELVVYLAGHPPGPNGYRHWRAASRDRKDWRGWAYLAALAALRDSGFADDFPLFRINVEATFIVAVARRRDTDNLIASLKPILDGLVDAKVVVDDSQEHLSISTPRIERGTVKGLVLRIREEA